MVKELKNYAVSWEIGMGRRGGHAVVFKVVQISWYDIKCGPV